MHGAETDDSSTDERNDHEELSRRDILAPFIQSSVSALGGFIASDQGRVYEMGDSCLGCLRDLKKFWRKDDMDDERTVARIFWETRVLPNDLVPILLETAGKGSVTDKRAIACGGSWTCQAVMTLRIHSRSSNFVM
jgi:replication fork protection complex subunit Tof1/Swi1